MSTTETTTPATLRPSPDHVVDEALDAFWAVVAHRYPEASTGDLSPETTIALSQQAEEAVREWVENNVPTRGNTCGCEAAGTTGSRTFTAGAEKPCEDRPPAAGALGTQGPPWYVGRSQCDAVYGGETHWAVLADNQRGVVADIEGGLAPEAQARADFIVRACNAHGALVNACVEAANVLEEAGDDVDRVLKARWSAIDILTAANSASNDGQAA